MISFEQPSRWVQLILKENICHGKLLEDGTTPLQDIKILAPSDARPHHKDRSIVLTSHSLSSTMDEHALKYGHSSPSNYTRRRARAPTPRRHSSTQTHLTPLQGDLESLRHSEYSPSRPQPSHSHPVHRARAHMHPEPSPSPAPSSSSSGLAQSRAYRQTEGIAPQPMRHSFTHPGGWPDRLQRPRTIVAHPQASRSTSHLDSGPSQPRRGKRKRPTGSESGTSAPQPVAAHRDTGGPQRSHRRHYNIAEKTQSTMLPSGGMYMTFPLDIPSPEPETEGRAGPPPFEHGPTDLPPRPYESKSQVEKEDSGPERPAKRGRLPADVMDHLPTIEGRLHKIEVSVQEYIDSRNERAMAKSKLPGS
jgi:hypothetical protein